jgi:hypothetical protein
MNAANRISVGLRFTASACDWPVGILSRDVMRIERTLRDVVIWRPAA